GGVEEIHQRLGDVLLIEVKPAAVVRRARAWRWARREIQRQIEIGVVAVVAQARLEVGRQVGVDERAEGAADAAGRGQDSVLLVDVAAARIERIDGRAAKRRRAGNGGKGRRRRIEINDVEGPGSEGQIAG